MSKHRRLKGKTAQAILAEIARDGSVTIQSDVDALKNRIARYLVADGFLVVDHMSYGFHQPVLSTRFGRTRGSRGHAFVITTYKLAVKESV